MKRATVTTGTDQGQLVIVTLCAALKASIPVAQNSPSWQITCLNPWKSLVFMSSVISFLSILHLYQLIFESVRNPSPFGTLDTTILLNSFNLHILPLNYITRTHLAPLAEEYSCRSWLSYMFQYLAHRHRLCGEPNRHPPAALDCRCHACARSRCGTLTFLHHDARHPLQAARINDVRAALTSEG